MINNIFTKALTRFGERWLLFFCFFEAFIACYYQTCMVLFICETIYHFNAMVFLLGVFFVINHKTKSEIVRYLDGIPITVSVFDFTPPGKLLEKGQGDIQINESSWEYDYKTRTGRLVPNKKHYISHNVYMENTLDTYLFIADTLNLRYFANEYFYALGYKNEKLTDVIEIAKGYHKDICAKGSQLFKLLSDLECDCFIITHNHPSGQKEPSDGDVEFTYALMKALNSYDMSLYDHIIIPAGTDNCFYSFKQYGLLV